MKKITFLTTLFLMFSVLSFGQISDLIISEYGEGSSGTSKYVEIYNGTGTVVDLSNYQLWRVTNGGVWPEATYDFTSLLLADGATLVVANNSTDNPVADEYSTSICTWNGDDAVGLAKDDGSGTFVLLDAVGTDGVDPGTGWDVAGVANGTKDNSLVRKETVCAPNTDWVISAGTDAASSEWIVSAYVTGTPTTLGNHTASCSTTTPTLTWNETVFNESTGNDGSISNAISLTLSNETFATVLSQMTESVDYTVANVPAGLTAVIVATTTTEASIGLTGNATNHADIDDVLDLTVTFLDVAFTGGDASVVANSSKNDLFVDFIDGAPSMEMTWDTTYYYEAVANNGSISNLINVTLSNETFATVGTLVSGTDYLVNNVPTGLSFEVISTSTTEATIALTGNAATHTSADDITNLSIAFLDDAFTNGDASAVANSSKLDLSVNFLDAYATDIIITEISYNPPEGNTDSLEFIEIYNNGTGVADLTDFYMAGVTYTFGNVSLNASEYYVISVNPTALQNFFGVTSEIFTGGLGNSGELVAIYNPAGDIVNALTFDDTTPWPGAQADGGGHSIVLCDYASDNSLGENWTISTNYVDTIADGSRVWASPGSADVICYTSPEMSWSATVFDEALINDGSISTVISLNLTDDEFATIGALLDGTDFISANVPAGLNLEITTSSTTNASMSLTGQALSHTNLDDISNLEITFTDEAFVSGFANNLIGYTDTLSVDFIDVTNVNSLNNSGISVYPNPTNGIVNITGQNINKIEVSNITGNIVLTSNETKLDMNELENGVYFIKVYFADNVSITRIVLSK